MDSVMNVQVDALDFEDFDRFDTLVASECARLGITLLTTSFRVYKVYHKSAGTPGMIDIKCLALLMQCDEELARQLARAVKEAFPSQKVWLGVPV